MLERSLQIESDSEKEKAENLMNVFGHVPPSAKRFPVTEVPVGSLALEDAGLRIPSYEDKDVAAEPGSGQLVSGVEIARSLGEGEATPFRAPPRGMIPLISELPQPYPQQHGEESHQ